MPLSQGSGVGVVVILASLYITLAPGNLAHTSSARATLAQLGGKKGVDVVRPALAT